MATPHIAAEPGDIAPAVLFPGDPRRAKRIAEQLMPDARLVSEVRGMLAFTGTVDGKPLSVMGSGMGMPSATLYATELYKFYDVQRVIRVGTCGGVSTKVKVGDTIVGLGAHTDSNMNVPRIPGLHYSAVASFNLAKAAVEAADDADQVHVGMIVSHDHFYLPNPDPNFLAKARQYGVLGIEMEAAGIYGAANEFGREALAVLTVSDMITGEGEDHHGSNMTAEERETRFQTALRLAVAAALS